MKLSLVRYLYSISILCVWVISPTHSTQPKLHYARGKQSEKRMNRTLIEGVVKRYKSGVELEEKVEQLLNYTTTIEVNRYREKLRLMVVYEILLRCLFREIGQVCSSNDSMSVYNPPHDKIHGEYTSWQIKLIKSGQIFCDPFQHLHCSQKSMKCECREGLVWKNNTCIVKVGGYCSLPPSDSSRPAFFDPFSSTEFDNLSEMRIPKPHCPQSCKNELKYFRKDICANDAMREIDKRLVNHFKNLPRLQFGNSCSSKYHSQLFESSVNYTIRLKNLENILKGKYQFCDHSRLLACDTTTTKCECIKRTIYDNTTQNCTFRSPHDPCQQGGVFYELAKILPAIGSEVMAEYERLRQQKCSMGCTGKQKLGRTSYHCILCPGYLIGKNCDTELTRFMDGWLPPSLPIDVHDYDEQYEVFMRFNLNARSFETLFRLGKGSPCDLKGEQEAYRSIRKIETLELTETVMTKEDYYLLTSSVYKTYRDFQKKGLCRYRLDKQGEPSPYTPPKNRPILSCGGSNVSNPICYEPTNVDYHRDLMNRVYGNSSQSQSLKDGQTCSAHVKQIIQMEGKFPTYIVNMPVGDRYDKWGNAGEYAYLFDLLNDQWVDNAQFCNRADGLICTFEDYKINKTGVCTFSEELFAEVLKEQAKMTSKHNSADNSMATSVLLTVISLVLTLLSCLLF